MKKYAFLKIFFLTGTKIKSNTGGSETKIRRFETFGDSGCFEATG